MYFTKLFVLFTLLQRNWKKCVMWHPALISWRLRLRGWIMWKFRCGFVFVCCKLWEDVCNVFLPAYMISNVCFFFEFHPSFKSLNLSYVSFLEFFGCKQFFWANLPAKSKYYFIRVERALCTGQKFTR